MYKCYCFSFADLFFSAPGSLDPCFFVGISFLSFWDVCPLNLVFRSFNCWFTSFVYEGKSPVCGLHILLPLFLHYFFLYSENIGLFSVFWRFWCSTCFASDLRQEWQATKKSVFGEYTSLADRSLGLSDWSIISEICWGCFSWLWLLHSESIAVNIITSQQECSGLRSVASIGVNVNGCQSGD